MIKRRFYKYEHGDKDNVSDSSSSSSDSEFDEEPTQQSDSESESEQEQEPVAQLKQNDQTCSTSSGYQSEDSSANEVGLDLADGDNDETEDDGQIFIKDKLPNRHGAQILETELNAPTKEDTLPDDFPACVLKCKSVFKCKLCPRIVCLNEETMRTHVKSKRHVRSEKLLKEGRLKAMLNSDGEIENLEIAEEAQAPVAQDKPKKKHKGGGRHQLGKGSKRKRTREAKEPIKDGSKRKRKNEN